MTHGEKVERRRGGTELLRLPHGERGRRCGGGAYVDTSIDTVSIIDPPVMNGGSAASRSALP